MAASIFLEQNPDGTTLGIDIQSLFNKEQSSLPADEDSEQSSDGSKYSVDLKLSELCKNCRKILENPALAASYYSPLHLHTLELKDHEELGKSDLVTTFVFREMSQPQVQFKVVTEISRAQFKAVRKLVFR